MKSQSSLSVWAIIVLILMASLSYAIGPTSMSYQGQVLTNTGAPIANGSYPAIFQLFPVAVGGSSIWSESGSITTTQGLFTHILGSITAIPDTLFPKNYQLFLEVTVNGQVQSPRTQMTASGYANSVNSVDRAMGGDILSGIGVGLSGFTDGYINLFSSFYGFPTAQLSEYGGLGAALEMHRSNGAFYGMLQPDVSGTLGGFFLVSNGNGSTGFMIDGDYASTGRPLMQMLGLSNVTFDLSSQSNNSIMLPDSAIGSSEILDEPGVVSNNAATSVTLTGTMQDLISVTITIPAPGYISLIGKIQEVDIFSAGIFNAVWAQIDETSGGSTVTPHASLFGGTVFPVSGTAFGTMNCQRIFYKATAGSYTFRLEAMTTGGPANTYYPTLTAAYFPTSYGSVTTMVNSAEVGGFENAVAVSGAATTPASGAKATDTYLVDLRELELRVAKAEAEAQKARTALAEAKLKEQLDAATSNASKQNQK